MSDTPDEKLIFISHRHVDKEMADVLRTELESWGDDIKIYQSSSAENGSRVGADLEDSIASNIANACLVLSVYSPAPGDMNWCMFECGLAEDPTAEKSKVVPFSSSDEVPEPLSGRLTVKLTPDSIRQFVHGFHTEADFLQGRPAYDPGLHDKAKKALADRLYKKLEACAPRPIESVPVYDLITFDISFADVEAARHAMQEADRDSSFTEAGAVISANAMIIGASGDPQEHFGFDIMTENLKLTDLVERWKYLSREDTASWAEELTEAIARAFMNFPEFSVTHPLQSLAAGGGGWLIPVVSQYRKMPIQERFEFDVLFCRLAREAGQRMAEITD